ncbi:DMT family transporter [Caulobacter sp. KR2-114]|uniref:DMT family transporter n=1 Tax=Caulobacter sp. KR2-114 TaxID=3400912 RepID=UPI003C092DDE
MSLRDFGLLVFVCIVWASSNVVGKLLISGLGAPPLFVAAARFAVVTLATAPFLFPAPGKIGRLIAVGLLMGAGAFGLLFIGLRSATPSAAAIVAQLGAPLTTLLSVIFLGERIRWRRGLGIVLTLIGVVIVMWKPGGISLSFGLLMVAASALSGSFGAVLLKYMDGVRPLQFQAWVGFSSFWPMAAASALFEHGQVAVLHATPWAFLAGVLYTGLVVSVVGHTAYYGLIQRYEANLLQPLTLMTPLGTVAMGVLITHDAFDGRMILGSAIALGGVLIIALRPNHVMPLLLAMRSRAP